MQIAVLNILYNCGLANVLYRYATPLREETAIPNAYSYDTLLFQSDRTGYAKFFCQRQLL
jgi:hypothetical protein